MLYSVFLYLHPFEIFAKNSYRQKKTGPKLSIRETGISLGESLAYQNQRGAFLLCPDLEKKTKSVKLFEHDHKEQAIPYT